MKTKPKKTTKPTSFLLLVAIALFSLSSALYGQSWQWLKAGGNIDSDSGPDFSERIKFMDSDPSGNVCVAFDQVLSTRGNFPFKIGNFLVPHYSGSDGIIASFGCDGNLRWTNAIGGEYIEENVSGNYVSIQGAQIKGINSDNDGNVYVTGLLTRGFMPFQPLHFSPTFTVPASAFDDNTHKEQFFIAKYSTNGVCQWVRFPENPNVVFLDGTGRCYAQQMNVDPNGTIHIDTLFYPGIFCNGALTITGAPNNLIRGILKYDNNGNYIGFASLANSYTDETYSPYRFLHNPNTDRYFFSRIIFYPEFPIIIGGQIQNKSIYVACFDSNGIFLWKKEDDNTNLLGAWDGINIGLTVDFENNIYLNCQLGRLINAQNEITTVPNGWNGQQIIYPENTDATLSTIIKMDPNGNTIWMKNNTNPESGSTVNTSVINGNELVIGMGFGRFGYDSIPDTSNTVNGYSPAILRINKDTGVGIALEQLYVSSPSTFPPSAIAAGPNGSFYLAGAFESSISLNASGSPATVKTGGYDDFYIAKFGTSNCTLASNAPSKTEVIPAYPNPVASLLYIANQESITYIMYDSLGKMVQMDALTPNGSIDLQHLASGIYLLQMTNEEGIVTTQKIVKE